MKEIQLSRGMVAFVDDEDYEKVSKHKWHVSVSRHKFYAETSIGKKYVKMHRFVSNESLCDIDHIDGNGLNNQKSNLRKATNQQNQLNKGKYKNNKSGYKGVSYDKPSGLWKAQIKFNHKKENLGLYDTKELAHFAYCKKSIELHGDFIYKDILDFYNDYCANNPDTTKDFIYSKYKELDKNNTSGYNGVSYDKVKKKFIAYYTKNKIRIYVGQFDSANDAYVAKELHKKQNNPD